MRCRGGCALPCQGDLGAHLGYKTLTKSSARHKAV
uniref:Tospeak-11 n=1 Tax=Homo sapiens TaxID=9606 RepID=F4YA23_HUMAN|nr:tospeak-11 [Homo sapiens]